MSPGLAQRYARAWRVAHITTPASVLCFCFGPDRAHQFHWRHKVVLIGACPLCHSRMLFVRAYPRETQEMLSDTGRASGQSRSTPEILWHSASSFS